MSDSEEQGTSMGIYDREYLRVGPRSSSGLGNVRVVSVNTWLIIINIAVFVLNNVVFNAQQWPVQQQRVFTAPGLSTDLRDRAEVDRTRMRPVGDGRLDSPLVLTVPDPAGRPRRIDVGFERFRPMPVVEAFGHFSTGKFWSDGQVWRLITFQFLHADIWHLVFNMLGLWFVGGLVEQYLGTRRYAAYYLTCGVFGALTYLLLNLLGFLVGGPGASRVPFLLFGDAYTPLIGASAGVFGVLMAAAYIAPDAMVDVLLIIPMRLQTAVYIFLALAVVNLWKGGANAGGDAAHVGGALAGAYLIRRPHLLRDILSALWLSRSPRKGGGARATAAPTDREVIDQILDKVSREGIQSLTEREKATLHRAARPTRGT